MFIGTGLFGFNRVNKFWIKCFGLDWILNYFGFLYLVRFYISYFGPNKQTKIYLLFTWNFFVLYDLFWISLIRFLWFVLISLISVRLSCWSLISEKWKSKKSTKKYKFRFWQSISFNLVYIDEWTFCECRVAVVSATWDLIAMADVKNQEGHPTHSVTFVWNNSREVITLFYFVSPSFWKFHIEFYQCMLAC